MGINGTKQDQNGINGAKLGQTGSNRAKRGERGQIGPHGAKQGQTRLIFCMHKYFYERKKSCLATQALTLKLAELWQFCHFLGYYRPSLKAWSLFLYVLYILKTTKIKTVLTSIQLVCVTRPTRCHLGAIRACLGPVGGALSRPL